MNTMIAKTLTSQLDEILRRHVGGHDDDTVDLNGEVSVAGQRITLPTSCNRVQIAEILADAVEESGHHFGQIVFGGEVIPWVERDSHYLTFDPRLTIGEMIQVLIDELREEGDALRVFKMDEHGDETLMLATNSISHTAARIVEASIFCELGQHREQSRADLAFVLACTYKDRPVGAFDLSFVADDDNPGGRTETLVIKDQFFG